MPDQPTPSVLSAPPAGTRGIIATYSLAAAALVAAVALRYVLDPWLGDSLPLLMMFGAVAAAVWIGGTSPAIAVAVLGYVACDYLFIPPREQFPNGGFNGFVGLLAYFFTAALVIGFGEAARRANARANERRELLRISLLSIGDAVITTDVEARVRSMNAVAETLTGWSERDALGRPLDDVFRIVNEDTREPVSSPATRALREGVVVGLTNHTVLISKDGEERPIDDSAAPIRDEHGRVSGCVLIFRDIAAQRELERERARQLLTARLLASIIESSDDAIIGKSLDGVIQSWNGGAERLFGYSAANAVGHHISLIIPSDRIAEEEQIITSLAAGLPIDHFETERLHADGRRIRVSLTISPIKDGAGVVVGASKIARDVTRQRQAEERERELLAEAAGANAKFQAFFEQGALFAGIADVSGRVIAANRQSWAGCGYSREEIVGKRVWEGPWWGSSPILAERLEQAARQAAAGELFRAELPYFLADGNERVADVTLQPITDDSGLVLFLAWSGVDITARKRAEADREKLVALVESSTDFIAMCDLAGVPFFVNRAGLAMTGLDSIDEARRTPVASFFFPEDQPRIVREFFPAVLERGHGEIEVRFRHFKTGEARWMAYKVLALPDASGQPVALATVSQDMTERKRLEDDLRRLAADLSDADLRKNEFLAMLAHELRNPLAPISNAARALRLAAGDEDAVRSASEMLERQVGQMSRLVDDLLDVSRITRGRIGLRKRPIELAAVVHQAVEAVRAQYKSMHQELTVTLPPRPLPLEADPERLAQVVGNLLNNACKFTDSGGRVWLSVDEEQGEAVVRVRDSGVGIAAEHLSRVFEMFAQVDTSLERSRGGLGIGLTLVKTLVEMHGGRVEARSDGLGHGSEFVVRLPVAADAWEAVVPSPPSAAAPGAARRVLIVDDSLDGAESLAMLLESQGHQTWQAHDGLEAIAAAERLRPDAVLLDIGLPRMNGYEACRRIRSEPWGKHLVLIALTGWGQEEDRLQSLEAGFDIHMVKPVDHDVLLDFLASLPAAETPAPE